MTLYDLARHGGHLVEVCSTTVETINGLAQQQERIYPDLSSLDRTHKEQVREYLTFQLQMMKNLQRRATSIQERIKAENSLVYKPEQGLQSFACKEPSC